MTADHAKASHLHVGRVDSKIDFVDRGFSISKAYDAHTESPCGRTARRGSGVHLERLQQAPPDTPAASAEGANLNALISGYQTKRTGSSASNRRGYGHRDRSRPGAATEELRLVLTLLRGLSVRPARC